MFWFRRNRYELRLPLGRSYFGKTVDLPICPPLGYELLLDEKYGAFARVKVVAATHNIPTKKTILWLEIRSMPGIAELDAEYLFQKALEEFNDGWTKLEDPF